LLIRIRVWNLDHSSVFFFIMRNRGILGDFLIISHTVTCRFLRNLSKWLTWIQNILGAIRQTSGSGLIQKSGFESQLTFSWYCGLGGVCVLWVLVCWLRSCSLYDVDAADRNSRKLILRIRRICSVVADFNYLSQPWFREFVCVETGHRQNEIPLVYWNHLCLTL